LNRQNSANSSNPSIRINSFVAKLQREETLKNMPKHVRTAVKIQDHFAQKKKEVSSVG